MGRSLVAERFALTMADGKVVARLNSGGRMHWSLARLVAFSLVGISVSASSVLAADDAVPTSVSTFHCLSLYWSPQGGEASRRVFVRFRQPAELDWHEGLPMRYNPVKTPECKGDYRGSI